MKKKIINCIELSRMSGNQWLLLINCITTGAVELLGINYKTWWAIKQDEFGNIEFYYD